MLVTAGIHLVSYLEQRWFAKHPPKWRITKAYQRGSSWAYYNPPVVLTVFVLYSYLFLGLYGDWKSGQIKQGIGKRLTVELATEAESGQAGRFDNVVLLGTSNKFVFVYDTASEEVNIVPNENIARLILAGAAAKP